MPLPVKKAGGFVVLLGTGIIGILLLSKGTHEERGELLREKSYRQDEIREESPAICVARGYRFYWKGKTLYRSPNRGGKAERVYVSQGGWGGQSLTSQRNLSGSADAVLTDKELLLIDEEPSSESDTGQGMYRLKDDSHQDIYIQNDPFLTGASVEPTGLSKRRVIPRKIIRAKSAPTLVRIRLDTDKIQTITSSLSFDGYHLDSLIHFLTPKGVYWVRPGSTEVVAVWSQSRTASPVVDSHVELRPQDSLMYLPFGEKSRVVRDKCVIRTLARLPDAILVFEAAPFRETPPIPLRISYEEPETPRPFRNAGYLIPRSANGRDDSASVGPSSLRNVVFNQRYYWVEWPTRILSSARDGSDVQLVSELSHENGDIMSIDSLFTDQKHLWVQYRVKNKDPKAMPVIATPSNNQQVGASMRSADATVESPSVPTIPCVSLLYLKQPPYTLGEPLRLHLSHEMGAGIADSLIYNDGYLYYDTADMEKAMFDAFSDKSTEHWVYRRWRLRLPLK